MIHVRVRDEEEVLRNCAMWATTNVESYPKRWKYDTRLVPSNRQSLDWVPFDFHCFLLLHLTVSLGFANLSCVLRSADFEPLSPQELIELKVFDEMCQAFAFNTNLVFSFLFNGLRPIMV